MAAFMIGRSARLVKRLFHVSFARIANPAPASSSPFGKVTRFEYDCKQQYSFPHTRNFCAAAFAKKLDIQENTVDDCISVGSMDFRECNVVDDAHSGAKAKTLTGAASLHTHKTVKCEGEDDEVSMMDGNVDVIMSGHEAQDVASTQPRKISSSTVDVKDAENEVKARDSDDNTLVWAATHVAHLLGIIEYENLTVLKTLPNSPDELFSNLSFLMSVGFTEKQLIDTISLHPSLMTMDLCKSLSRVMKCLQKVELDASFLKQVLIAKPGLVSLLAKRVLQERVKALRELEFPDQDIGTLLKRLGCNQLERFLSLPVEKIEATFTYIRDEAGLRSSEAMKLVSSFPSVLLRDVGQDYASKLIVMRNVFEELKTVKKLFMHLPELLARKTDALEETVLCLKDMVKDAKKLSQIIEANPRILTHRKSGLEPVFVFLQSLGFDSKISVSLIGREPYLVECGSDRLNKHVEFLKSKGFNENAIISLMERSTGMFFKSLEKQVAPNFDFLENQGITGESLQKYMKFRPQVCSRSLKKSLNPNLDLLLSFGFEKDSPSLKHALKVILPHSHRRLQARVNYLISLNIDSADVHKMVREEPAILVTTESPLKKRVNFLTKVMKQPARELVKCPSFLVSNIDKVIMPRLKVFEWLCSKGLLRKFSLSSLVETDEAVFMKKFVQAHPEALSIYKSSPRVDS